MMKSTKMSLVLLVTFSVTSAALAAQPQLTAEGKTNLKRDYTVFFCPMVNEMKYWTANSGPSNCAGYSTCWTAGADSGLGGTKNWAGIFSTTDRKRPEFVKNVANQVSLIPSRKNKWLIQCAYTVKNGAATNQLFTLNITPDDGFKECVQLGTTTSVVCYKN